MARLPIKQKNQRIVERPAALAIIHSLDPVASCIFQPDMARRLRGTHQVSVIRLAVWSTQFRSFLRFILPSWSHERRRRVPKQVSSSPLFRLNQVVEKSRRKRSLFPATTMKYTRIKTQSSRRPTWEDSISSSPKMPFLIWFYICLPLPMLLGEQ